MFDQPITARIKAYDTRDRRFWPINVRIKVYDTRDGVLQFFPVDLVKSSTLKPADSPENTPVRVR